MTSTPGPEETLQSLEAAGVPGARLDWERLLVINYTTLVRPHFTIIDVGGKKGRHVAVFLKRLRAARIYVYEPNPRMADILRRRYGGLPPLAIVEKALADHGGTADFTVNVAAPGESGLRPRTYSDPDRARTRQITVPVARLDDEVFEGPVGYVKIDVEGGEIDVLRGGRALLARHRPIVSVEYGRPSYAAYGHTADTLYEEAAVQGYAVCDLFGNVFVSLEAWRACVDRLYWDYVLVPRERLDALAAARAGIAAKSAAELARQARLRALARRLPLFAPAIERRLKRLA